MMPVTVKPLTTSEIQFVYTGQNSSHKGSYYSETMQPQTRQQCPASGVVKNFLDDFASPTTYSGPVSI